MLSTILISLQIQMCWKSPQAPIYTKSSLHFSSLHVFFYFKLIQIRVIFSKHNKPFSNLTPHFFPLLPRMHAWKTRWIFEQVLPPTASKATPPSQIVCILFSGGQGISPPKGGFHVQRRRKRVSGLKLLSHWHWSRFFRARSKWQKMDSTNSWERERARAKVLLQKA